MYIYVLSEIFKELFFSEMKKNITVIFLIFATYSAALCQTESTSIKTINNIVLTIESAATIQPNACVDSSNISIDPYKELYYKNRLLDELCKVEKTVLRPDVRITYYFYNKSLIKVIVIDKSTEFTFNIDLYFHDNKLIHTTHKSIDGANPGIKLIKSAKEYLERYELIAKML